MSPTNRVLLVIDDEPDILNLITISIELSLDWTILTALSAKEGIDQAVSGCPDLILSDFDLPEINGLQMAQVLHNNVVTKHIPIVLLTGRWKELTAKDYTHLGVKEVIPKPFDPLLLADYVSQVVNQK